MESSDWVDLNVQALRDWFKVVSVGPPLEFDGVTAGLATTVPARSVFNSVAYTDPAALRDHYTEIAAVYAEAGCAWTVWVPERDTEIAAMLEEAGHTLDAQPRAMGMDLAGFEQPDLTGIDWNDSGEWETMCLINDRAFGLPEGTWQAGMRGRPDGSWIYMARVDGDPVATVLATDHPGHDATGDCSIWCVATLEAARGRGLSTALMAKAAADARERGCATTTLQATKLGRPVYERVGYRDFGAIGMWEFRPAAHAAEAHPRPAA